MRRRSRDDVVRGLCGRAAITAVLVLAATSLGPTSAIATPPVLQSVTVPLNGNHPTLVWSLPPGVASEFVQTARSPRVDENGYFPSVVSFSTLPATQTTFSDPFEYANGTYYTHVAGHDVKCRGAGTCPPIEFTEVMSFQVPGIGSGPGGPGTLPDTRGGPGPDRVKPLQNLSFAPVQDIDKLFVRARMSEPGTLRAAATVSVGGASKVYRFKAVSRPVAANVFTKLRLRLAKKNLKAVKRALAKRKRLRAKITVTAVDKSGNKRAQKATVRLKR
jgi:hypothetical protein